MNSARSVAQGKATEKLVTEFGRSHADVLCVHSQDSDYHHVRVTGFNHIPPSSPKPPPRKSEERKLTVLELDADLVQNHLRSPERTHLIEREIKRSDITMADQETLEKLPQYMNLQPSDHMKSPVDAKISGSIPTWLKGSVYQNGSGVYRIGPTSWNHLFDGYSVLQRFTFQDGKVTYQQSVLDTPEYKKSIQHNKIIGPGFAHRFPDPTQSSASRFFKSVIPTPPNVSEKTNISVMEFGDRLFAMADTPLIHEITPDTMSLKSTINISDIVSVQLGTAHPHKLKDGSLIYYGTNMNYTKSYNFISVPPQPTSAKNPFSGAKVIASAPSRFKTNISFTHSFGITENYFVQLEQPLTMSLPDFLLMQPRGRNIVDCFIDQKSESMDILLISKSSGHRVPISYKAPSGVVFHFANCYEDSDHVICDVAFWPGGSGSVKNMFLPCLAEGLQAGDLGLGRMHFARFVLPLKIEGAEPGKNLVTLPNTSATAMLKEKSNKPVVVITPETIEESLPIEVPQINTAYGGLKCRYCYASTFYYSSQPRVAKYDLYEKRVVTFDVGKDYTPGEAIFVSRPDATEEDDGVVLCSVIACHSGAESYLLVLDAASFQEIGRASLPAEIKMGMVFHAMFTDKFV
ncbi:beta,beta-carotene 15,15'-dioxygenase [Plakobranchus ocellatus]|uniref:Beta,beta-carotene 15,15'-dioxygenase n=1 Tax=Plakobranchus ocellatus TaxID=259542 RepID=A0AAV3ZKY3_9GAST|nr:beta,beta-carotene 15,15'-dioxygenase [Plakobranchus ocellatus]